MPQLQIQQAQFQLSSKKQLNIPHFVIQTQDFWAIVGYNGSGKSAFAQTLEGKLRLNCGDYLNDFKRIQLLSFERQQQIVEQNFRERNNDTNDPDDFGKTAKQMILGSSDKLAQCQQLAQQLGIGALLDRAFIKLSTGESRKVLLAQALLTEPELLILDEPFEGLDQQSVRDWQQLLTQLAEKMAIVLIINRFADIPTAVKNLAVLDNCELILQGKRSEIEQHSIFQQLQYAESASLAPLPACHGEPIKLAQNTPHFELRNLNIQYGEKKILCDLSWTVQPHQHWLIKGPNGAGKSTLLSVLTGDQPQAFSNYVHLFGRQRGSGETIWDIKSKIGYISSQLHMDYRVNCSALDVIISGFFDSIGVYQQVPAALKIKAQQWLERIGLRALANRPFRSLSWGQQRLLLITRAMVKYPPVLILDEPLQGLDGLNRTLVKHFIDQLVRNSQTQLLFVSHQIEDAPDCITHIFEFVAEGEGYRYVQTAV